MATHRCQSTAEGEHNGVMARKHTQKPHRVKKKKKNVNTAGALYFCAVCLSHIIAADTFFQPFYLTFFFPPPFLRALFKVILALHMAD